MKPFSYVMNRCPRCKKNYSILDKFVFGRTVEDVKQEYGNICPECLSDEEKQYIIQRQMEECVVTNVAGGTGLSHSGKKLIELKEYLSVF